MQSLSSKEALFKCKCPKCRQGDMFKYTPRKKWFSSDMYDNCPNCKHTFEPEPGFYYGAMFISYAFSLTITFVAGVALNYLYIDPPIWAYLLLILTLIGICWPLMIRYSRSIFLHLFGGIKYDSKYANE